MQSNSQLKCCHKFCIAHYDYAHSLALGHGIILHGMTILRPENFNKSHASNLQTEDRFLY